MDSPWQNKSLLPARPPVLMPPALTEQQLDVILRGSSTFSFHFQPIVDLQRGSAVGFEALARFSVDDARVAPNLVFDAAGTFGRRLELEEKVLSEAIEAQVSCCRPTAFFRSTSAPATC